MLFPQLQAMQEFILAQKRSKSKEEELMNRIEGVNYGNKTRITKDGLVIKYEYDSDEDCENGTWEHKLRQAEMEATRGNFFSVLPVDVQFPVVEIYSLDIFCKP